MAALHWCVLQLNVSPQLSSMLLAIPAPLPLQLILDQSKDPFMSLSRRPQPWIIITNQVLNLYKSKCQYLANYRCLNPECPMYIEKYSRLLSSFLNFFWQFCSNYYLAFSISSLKAASAFYLSLTLRCVKNRLLRTMSWQIVLVGSIVVLSRSAILVQCLIEIFYYFLTPFATASTDAAAAVITKQLKKLNHGIQGLHN